MTTKHQNSIAIAQSFEKQGETMFVKTKILSAEKEQDVLKAISIIQKGQIIALPTETVYGLAADAKNIDAVKRVFAVKNRPYNHPLIVHIASFDKLSEWAKDIPPVAEIIAKHFWPGPITLLFKKNHLVNDVVTGGLNTIAIRIPQNKTLLKILHQLDTGLAAPSANPYQRISPTTAQHVISSLSGKIDAVLDDGPCHIGIESTIVDLTKSRVAILRHGPITKKMIEDVLGASIDSPLNHTENVPGNMKSHYQPYTISRLMTLDEIEMQVSLAQNNDKLFGVIHYSSWESPHKNIKKIKLSKNKAQYAREIYKALHELDKIDANEILIEVPPNKDEWCDILDRLGKASAK